MQILGKGRCTRWQGPPQKTTQCGGKHAKADTILYNIFMAFLMGGAKADMIYSMRISILGSAGHGRHCTRVLQLWREWGKGSRPQGGRTNVTTSYPASAPISSTSWIGNEVVTQVFPALLIHWLPTQLQVKLATPQAWMTGVPPTIQGYSEVVTVTRAIAVWHFYPHSQLHG